MLHFPNFFFFFFFFCSIRERPGKNEPNNFHLYNLADKLAINDLKSKQTAEVA